MQIHTKTENYIFFDDLEIENYIFFDDLEIENEEFKQFLLEFDNGFTTEIVFNQDHVESRIYSADLHSFLDYEKESLDDDFKEISHYEELEKLNDFLIKEEIDYIQF